MFAGQSETWRSNAELLVTYQDVTETYPLENAEILLDETVRNAKTGTQNSFVFELPSSTTRSFLSEHFPVADFSEGDIDAINGKLETALQGGQIKTQVSISDDSLSIDREQLAAVAFPSTLLNEGSSVVIEALDGIQLAPESQFSFLEFVAGLPLNDVSDAQLTQIASAIYSTVLQTNFLIDERSIGSQVPDSIPLGQEASINRQLGIDLIFTNPNESSFTLNLSIESDSLNASIAGYPYQYSYTIGITEETNIEPRLIKQFSAFVSSGNQVESEGQAGKRLNVIRTIFDGGEVMEVETVSNDFYPPVHRVEVHALAQSEAETSVPVAGEPGFIDTDGDGIHDETPINSFPTIGQPGFIDLNGDGVHDGIITLPTIGQPGFVDENEDGIHDGTPAITVPVEGQPGFVDENGDGIHDTITITPTVPSAGQPSDSVSDDPTAPEPTEDENTADEVPIYDKGGKLIPK
nr:VanW family protein [Planococcus sp. MSAK28401]